jgi:hypothetical protein
MFPIAWGQLRQVNHAPEDRALALASVKAFDRSLSENPIFGDEWPWPWP